jgi:cutinase
LGSCTIFRVRVTHRVCGRVVAAAVAAGVLLTAPTALPGKGYGAVATASAANCPQTEVVFARGRYENPGAGQVGNAFISALRAKTGKNVGLYAVNYPADTQIDEGANDMSQHVQNMIANCPDTRLVLGGYSLGAGVTDMVLAMPFSAFGFNNPLPPDTDQHIAAVAVFGNGIQWVGPIGNFNPVYTDRTIDLCNADDPICNPTDPNNWQTDWPDHLAPAYIKSGMVNQAADFVAGKL